MMPFTGSKIQPFIRVLPCVPTVTYIFPKCLQLLCHLLLHQPCEVNRITAILLHISDEAIDTEGTRTPFGSGESG